MTTEPEPIKPCSEDEICVDRARFERLIAVAQAAYADSSHWSAAMDEIQPGDLDPLP